MRDAGLTDAADVHYVQTKTPLLTIESVADAHRRGHSVACKVHESMDVSNGTTALGIAVALGEISMPRAEQICRDFDLYSSVASCSSGVELTRAQIVLMGNRAGAGGRYRIGHGVMKDALDLDGVYEAIRSAGLAAARAAPRRGSGRAARQLLREVRGGPPRDPARPPADHAGRFGRAPPPPCQGGGRGRGGGRDRRPGRLRLGGRDAPGAPRRRARCRDRRRRRVIHICIPSSGRSSSRGTPPSTCPMTSSDSG